MSDIVTKDKIKTTFSVANVDRAEQKLKESDVLYALSRHTLFPEAWSNQTKQIVPVRYNAFLASIRHSFNDHRPLVLSPDVVWIVIAQGFSNHINANAEELRHHFVKHQGKEYLEIRRDGFVKGSSDNNWEGCFKEFSMLIKERIGDKHDLIVSDFSTTGHVERAVSEIILMDSMKSYFSYGMRSACGIPEITLEGKTEDWQKIKDKVEQISEFGCEWWTRHLLLVMDYFIDASRGNVDVDFWNSLYHEGGGSGGPFVSGWINAFFPYLKNNEINKFLERTKDIRDLKKGGGMMGGAPNDGDYPNSLSKAPFKWTYYENVFEMEFVGGAIGLEQGDDLSLKPYIGWAINDTKQKIKCNFCENEMDKIYMNTPDIGPICSRNCYINSMKQYHSIKSSYNGIKPKRININQPSKKTDISFKAKEDIGAVVINNEGIKKNNKSS